MTIPFTTIYKPLTVQIEGKDYPVRRLNRHRCGELMSFQEKLTDAAQKGTFDILYDEVALLVDAPREVIDELDLTQVRDITRWLIEALFGGPEQGKAAEDPEKNGPRPGDETPQG